LKQKVWENWSLPVRSRKNIDVWKKIKMIEKILKGWNINVEGRHTKLKKELMVKIEILEKKTEFAGISDSERPKKLDMEWNLKKK
jgi:hypothetical protein